MARGGKRGGTPGASYPNRTDLPGTPRPLPVSTVPGQPYGAAGAQTAAQTAVPMAPAPLPTPPGGGAPPPTPTTAPGSAPGPVAGSAPLLIRPSERPGEPVTAGAPVGAGPGPEALGLNTPDTLGAVFARIAASPDASPEVLALANYVNNGRR